jgi:hypothetical protein
MNQREAVYTATRSVLKDANVSFEDGGDVGSVMTDDLRKRVHAIVCQGFQDGNVSFKNNDSNAAKLSNEVKLSVYVSGLISNWYRKDARFNGNSKYSPKNPGSRTGSTDSQIKALKALHKQFTAAGDSDKVTSIEEALKARTAELAVSKIKKVTIDTTVLPASLVKELGLSAETEEDDNE